MQFELRSNGVIQIDLTPETDIERAFIKAFAEGASKGRTVKLVPAPTDGSGALIMSMEK